MTCREMTLTNTKRGMKEGRTNSLKRFCGQFMANFILPQQTMLNFSALLLTITP